MQQNHVFHLDETCDTRDFFMGPGVEHVSAVEDGWDSNLQEHILTFEVNAYSGAVHPLVHHHPITGRKAS